MAIEEINYFDICVLDQDHEWEQYFIQKCGINYQSYCVDRELLKRDALESVVDEIVDGIEVLRTNLEEGFKIHKLDWVLSIDSIHIGYQILGYFLLKLDIAVPIEVYDSILISTDWNYDGKRGWSEEYINIRRSNLKLFRDYIIKQYSKGIT